MSLSDQIFEVVKQAGPAGVSPVEIAQRTGQDRRLVGYHIKRMADLCKVKRLLPPKAKPQLFALETTAKPLTRTRDLAKITKAQPRNATLSPERIQIEALLKNAHQAMRVVTIADKTGINRNQVRIIMARLAHDGIATNVGTSKETSWRATKKIKAAQESAHARSIGYHCGGTMPHAKTGDLPCMECVR